MTKGSLSQPRVGSSSIRIAALALHRFFPGVKKTSNHLGQISLERANRSERNIDKPMLSASFHELRNAMISIDIHHNEKAASSVDLDDLPQDRDFAGMPIRFNNNAGYIGTHRTPQQNE
ncbi:MAG TPA: hypothetical protein VK574_18330 [Terracidiphilus sp.]|nr:hypothetical protein [Terracidiphilus sp.]